MATSSEIKKELAQALREHIVFLKVVERADDACQDGLLFVIKSFSFMLERVPDALISDNEEDLYFAAFQYYNLLAELKQNLKMSYSDCDFKGENLLELLKAFPSSYEEDLNLWWEQKTGLKVNRTKQTIDMG